MALTMDQAQQMIKEEKPFRFGRVHDGQPTFSGGPWLDSRHPGSFGALPEIYRDQVVLSRYVVWSYWTPIAWVNQDGTKTVPDIGYSQTTGQHLMTVMAAWDLPVRYPARGRELRRSGGGPRRGGIDDL